MDPDAGPITESLLVATRVLVAMAIQTVNEAQLPLTLTQHRVLLLLEEAGGLSVNDVAARLGVDQSNASRHCTRLTDLGLVDRRPSVHDGRSVDLRLTDMGRRQVRAVRGARRRWAGAVLAHLSEDQTREVVLGLELLARAAHAVSPEETSPLL
jgi:DNA-binding MarR family transcriptional regulator